MDDLVKELKSCCECYPEEVEELCTFCVAVNEIVVLRKEKQYWKSIAERLMKING